MKSGEELEHEAFLSLWLLRFVFPSPPYGQIGKHVFPIAVHLSRGIRMALAPAVLSSIYRDLRWLSSKMVSVSNMKGSKGSEDCLPLLLWAPFQLVQLWAWERLLTLQPLPNLIKHGEQRLARWHEVTKLKIENVRLAVQASGEYFKWRPYAAALNNWALPKFYGDEEEWLVLDSNSDMELQSFAVCLRASELVGLDCIKQYSPHRVALQFGLDQDLCDSVPRSNSTPEAAWENYSRPISGTKLYLPHRLFESDVTTRYLEWWKLSVILQKEPISGVVRKQRSLSRRRLSSRFRNKEGDRDRATGNSPSNHNMEQPADSDEDDPLTILELLKKKGGAGNLQSRSLLPSCTDEIYATNSEWFRKLRSSQDDEGAGIELKSSVKGSSITENGAVSVRKLESSIKPPYSIDAVKLGLESSRGLPSCKDGVAMLDSSIRPAGIKLELRSSNSCADNGRKSDSSTKQSAFNGAALKVELEPPVEQPPCKDAEETVQMEETVGRQNSLIGVFETGDFVNATESRKEETVVCGTGSHERLGLELEARIDKLEKVIAWLKAGRHRNA